MRAGFLIIMFPMLHFCLLAGVRQNGTACVYFSLLEGEDVRETHIKLKKRVSWDSMQYSCKSQV